MRRVSTISNQYATSQSLDCDAERGLTFSIRFIMNRSEISLYDCLIPGKNAFLQKIANRLKIIIHVNTDLRFGISKGETNIKNI